MSNGFLSQEEIDALLNGGADSQPETPIVDLPELSDLEKDLLGEIGNISMGSASTALSQIIGQPVNITTPVVSITTLKQLKDEFEVPNISLEVKYTSGIMGENLLLMKVVDALVIANLMMGGDGAVQANSTNLTEIEESAVSEAMNQMVGSAATSMATMFMREVNISPPTSKIWDDLTNPLAEGISEDEPIVKVSFSLNIGTLVDSYMMQLLPMETAKKIVSIMMGQEEPEPPKEQVAYEAPKAQEVPSYSQPEPKYESYQPEPVHEKPIEMYRQPPVEVHQAAFQPLDVAYSSEGLPKNIDLILDVPLEISVVLGRTKKNIRDILNLGTGSLVELDKLAEEPVDVLINGKKVAYGEVVVVDENFGVRITSIVSSEDRIKSLVK